MILTKCRFLTNLNLFLFKQLIAYIKQTTVCLFQSFTLEKTSYLQGGIIYSVILQPPECFALFRLLLLYLLHSTLSVSNPVGLNSIPLQNFHQRIDVPLISGRLIKIEKSVLIVKRSHIEPINQIIYLISAF